MHDAKISSRGTPPSRGAGVSLGSRALLVLLAIAFAGPGYAETAQFCATADTWIRESDPQKNYGDEKDMKARAKTGDRRHILMRFDVSSLPAGAVVSSANVNLWVEDLANSGVGVHRVTSGWTESGATWQNTANAFATPAETTFTPSRKNSFQEFDIASLVQGWLNGDHLNHGIMLIVASGDQELKVTSREDKKTSRHPCMTVTYTPGSTGAAAYFEIRHAGSGFHCTPAAFSVTARSPTAQTLTSYAKSVTLTTQTGAGSFSSASTNNGIFSDAVPDDGLATYTFDAQDAGVASFFLTYPGAAGAVSTIDLGTYQTDSPSIRDDDSEGLLYLSPGGFSMTASAVPDPAPTPINDPIGAKTAGTPFAVHLAASAGADASSFCGIASGYSGDKMLRFWFEALDPVVPVLVPTINGQAIAASEATALTQIVRFTNGRAAVTARYKDTGRLAIRVVDTSASTPIRGSTGGFVSLPADLRIVSVQNATGTANPGSSTPAGTLFARAGEAFRVTVDAVDADGDRTPSFGREAVPEGIRLRSAALVAPAGGRNGLLDDGSIANATAFSADALPGRFVGTTFSFDEVGAIRLQASIADGDFLAAGPVAGTESATIGRFAPSHFLVAANTPRFATACPLGAFTWLGQPFHYVAGLETELTVTAVSRAGTTTANYAGTWFRMTQSTLSDRRYQAGTNPIDESGLPSTAVDPSISANGDGTARLRFSTGTGLALARGTPVAPFDAEIELALNIIDADTTAYPSNPFRVGGTTAGTGIDFDVSKRFQMGRIRLDNAYGSELVALPMRLRAQRFDGTAFTDDDNDSCSSVSAATLVHTPSPAGLGSSPSVSHVPFFAGDAGLSWSAPGSPGYVEVRVDLGASGANLPWLRFDWPEDGNLDGALDDDPRARATFGIWKGRNALIFFRELY